MKEEEEEVARVRSKDELRKREQERVKRESDVSAKVFSCLSVKALVSRAKGSAFDAMDKSGVFFDPDLKMVEEEFMPWLCNLVDDGFKDVVEAQGIVDEIIMSSLQQQLNEQNKLKQLLADQEAARLQALREAEEKAKIERETIRIFIDSSDLGLGEGVPEKIGPIPVRETLPLEETEKVIQAWIKANVEGEFDPPEGGYLRLALGGAALDMSKPLTQQDVTVSDETVFEASLALPDEPDE